MNDDDGFSKSSIFVSFVAGGLTGAARHDRLVSVEAGLQPEDKPAAER